MKYSELKNLSAESPNTDFLIISRPIDRKLHYDLTECLENNKARNQRCHVFLTTYGGDPHGGYRVARCLSHYYKFIKLIVPSYCKSAGTMIAIAANELAIGDLGELGPLDVQVIKPNEMQERGSGLDIMTALNLCHGNALEVFERSFMQMRNNFRLSAKQAGELAINFASQVMAPLYSQIEPLRMGELQRALSITLAYGENLNKHSNNLEKNTLRKLVSGYPAHGFVIDRKEAKSLFKSVVHLTQHEEELCAKLWRILQHQSDEGPFFLEENIEGAPNVQLDNTSKINKNKPLSTKPSNRNSKRRDA